MVTFQNRDLAFNISNNSNQTAFQKVICRLLVVRDAGNGVLKQAVLFSLSCVEAQTSDTSCTPHT
jgi:hypothetical protein